MFASVLGSNSISVRESTGMGITVGFLKRKWFHRNFQRRPFSIFVLSFFHIFLMGSGARLRPYMKAGPTGCCLTCSLKGTQSAWPDLLEVMAFGLLYCSGLFDKAY